MTIANNKELDTKFIHANTDYCTVAFPVSSMSADECAT